MSRFDQWLDRRIEDEGLARIEADYVRSVGDLARVYLAEDRRRIVDEVVEHLAERPPADDARGLETALGSPRTYAARVAVRLGATVPTRGDTLRRVPRWAWATAILVAIPVVAAGYAAWRYSTDTPAVPVGCVGGAAASSVEYRSAAETDELVMSVDVDERAGIEICPFFHEEGVTLVDAYVPTPWLSPVQFVGAEQVTCDDTPSASWTGDASGFGPLVPAPNSVQRCLGYLMLWFEGDLACGTRSFDDYEVVYRYRGRTRTMTVPFGAVYTFTGGDGRACTESEVPENRWRRAAGRDLGAYDPVGDHDLAAIAASSDLCRYLRGVDPVPAAEEDFNGGFVPGAAETLTDRAVYRLDDRELAEHLIRVAVRGLCREFKDDLDELLELLGT